MFIYKHKGKILNRNSKIATDPSCCCGKQGCCCVGWPSGSTRNVSVTFNCSGEDETFNGTMIWDGVGGFGMINTESGAIYINVVCTTYDPAAAPCYIGGNASRVGYLVSAIHAGLLCGGTGLLYDCGYYVEDEFGGLGPCGDQNPGSLSSDLYNCPLDQPNKKVGSITIS